jgi:hypothetical protein
MEAILVGTLDGVYRVVREDGGWRIATKELAGAEVNCLVVRPDRREVIYAGVRGGGLYRTDDGGQHWNTNRTSAASPSTPDPRGGFARLPRSAECC